MTKLKNKNTGKISLWKKIKFILFITIVSLVFFIILSETYLAIFNPQPYLYPRLSYSEKYRKIPPENVTMVHCVPPHKRYYSVNQYNLRGKVIPLSNEYDKSNIILLGDSFTFGIGVNDGNEYAAIMANNLKSKFNIINTGCGGWGLTQQIRRFYEFGQLYNPEIVLLLFSGNDPDDNLKDNCTRIENDRFVFSNFYKEDNLSVYWLNKLLSKSIIQKSNLYMVISRIIWPLVKKNQINETKYNYEGTIKHTKSTIPLKENLYNELLNLFAKDLHEKEITFYFMSVNSYSENKISYQLDKFPYIKENVLRLNTLGLIDYININEWFTKDDFVSSPVSHYDKRWNFVLGENLAKHILNSRTIGQSTHADN
ncbi:MAG: SGNH/GDSL hydrolase family protein [Bacteroidetes bacterium]|nr:SGNH/GDSL hydrolase family protein [Bacteroidota bacterium]